MSIADYTNGMNRKEFASVNTLYNSEDQLEGARAFAKREIRSGKANNTNEQK